MTLTKNIIKETNPSKLEGFYYKFYDKYNKKKFLFYVIENPNCPVHILENFISNNPFKEHYILGNPNCPTHFLEDFYSSINCSNRVAIAKNPNCPVEILEKLANDKNLSVKFSVANNKNSNINILEKMFNEPNNFLSIDLNFEITNNINCTNDLLKKIYFKYKNTNHCILDKIKSHQNWRLKDFD